MVRQWRHLKMLKRAGRGQDLTGVAGTQRGELAVECPACPKPGVNLPDGWEKTSPDKRCGITHRFISKETDQLRSFLYRHFVSLDACFRVKRFDVSDETKDPIIDEGLAYFVPDKPYKELVKKYKTQAPVSIVPNRRRLYNLI